MSVLARLWDRVSGSQPLPPAWVVGLTGLLALCVVLYSQSWRVTVNVITIAHVVFCILGAIAATNGQRYRVPFAIRLVK